MAAPEFVYTVYIAAPAERVWNALVDGDLTRQYWGHENRSDWKPGLPLKMLEDPRLEVGNAVRSEWLSQWHGHAATLQMAYR